MNQRELMVSRQKSIKKITKSGADDNVSSADGGQRTTIVQKIAIDDGQCLCGQRATAWIISRFMFSSADSEMKIIARTERRLCSANETNRTRLPMKNQQANLFASLIAVIVDATRALYSSSIFPLFDAANTCMVANVSDSYCMRVSGVLLVYSCGEQNQRNQ